jgi:transcriptional regulator with XRE-family HTH domain
LAQSDDAERFATRLRALKERAGLSFEELARRIGVSSSSLHRYCAGAKIPPGYGTVHAFAVACGVKGEELKELHKLWALAEASRSFPAPPANVVEEEAEEEEAAVPPPVAERSRRGRRRAFGPAFFALLVISVMMNVVAGVDIFRHRSMEVASRAQITPRPSATAPVRVFNVEGDCKALKERLPACGLGLARNPYLKYGAENEVAHRVWHNDVLTADCILYDGAMVRDETGVETTRWFRVRLNDVPGGHAWLPAVRTHDSPNLPTCYK